MRCSKCGILLVNRDKFCVCFLFSQHLFVVTFLFWRSAFATSIEKPKWAIWTFLRSSVRASLLKFSNMQSIINLLVSFRYFFILFYMKLAHEDVTKPFLDAVNNWIFFLKCWLFLGVATLSRLSLNTHFFNLLFVLNPVTF